jgi:hypothetical protein
MAGAGDVETRGAIEVGERDGGQPQADSAGVKGVVGDHAAFHKARAVGEVLWQLEAEEKVSSLVGRPYVRQALNALRSCAFRNGIREASTRKLLWGQGRDSEEGSEVVTRLSLSFTRRKGDSLPSQKFKRPI